MFGFIEKVFIVAMTFFGYNALGCKIRPQVVNINSDNPFFYPYSIEVKKCSGTCNNIHDPYAKLCVPNVVKNINVRVSNLVSTTTETRHIEWHETCKCKCRLDISVNVKN